MTRVISTLPFARAACVLIIALLFAGTALADIRGPDYVRTVTDDRNDVVLYFVLLLVVLVAVAAALWLACWGIRKGRKKRSQQ